MFEPINDGVDHINIYSKGRTELGKLLSNFSFSPFRYEPYGLFNSVEGFWYYYFSGCKHNDLRTLSGYMAKKIGKRYKAEKDHVITDEEKEIILGAIRCKLKQNREILDMLVENTLPLTHYYYYGELDNPKVYYMDEYSWITDEIERIRLLMIKKLIQDKLMTKT